MVRKHTGGTRRNVLILLADDLGVDMVGIYAEGANPPPTPNLDALAAGGVLFRNVWSDPVCSPTRSTIQTGRHGTRTGIGNIVELGGAPLALAETTLPELLDQGTGGAYAHAAFGKWHLGDDSVGGALAPNLAGYGHFSGALSNFFGGEDYFNWTKVVDGVTSQSSTYATTETVDDASAWIAATQEPWFCYVAFNAPHVPYHAPPPGLHTVDLSAAGPVPGLDPVPYYRAMVSAMDTEIGRLLAEMDPAVRARTTIIFLGDNGSTAEVSEPPFDPAHAKATLYEGGVRVPLIVSGPPVTQPGRESAALVNTTDVFASVAALAGVDLTSQFPGLALDSISFVPQLVKDGLPSERKYLFAEAFQPNGTADQPPQLQCVPPPGNACQLNLGFGGPGISQLSLCGQQLYGEASADFLLIDAPPNTAGWLAISDKNGMVPLGAGTLVPSPILTLQPFVTDAQGTYTQAQKVEWVFAASTFYAQAVLVGAGGPSELSNAVQFDFDLADQKAIRDGRYKLIVNPYLCVELFFDLLADPFEQLDLIAAGPLAPEQMQAYAALRVELATLLGP